MITPAYRQEKARRLRLAQGIPGYIPIDRITGHIHLLQQAGWTNIEIADTAGVNRRTVQNILHRYVSTVHRPTAAKILGLRPADVPNRVPSIGTMRRMQALAVMGWPLLHIGQEAGIHGSQVNELMAGRRKRIPRAHAEAIDRIYRERWTKPGPSKRTRTIALRNGWVTALAWNDIDDPDETPTGLRTELAS